jgi:hypothetical protein
MHCYDAAGPKRIYFTAVGSNSPDDQMFLEKLSHSHVICSNMCVLLPCTLAIPATFPTLLSCWKSGYIFAGAPTRRIAVLFPDQFIPAICSFPGLLLKIYPYRCRKWNPGRPTRRPSLYRLSYPDVIRRAFQTKQKHVNSITYRVPHRNAFKWLTETHPTN